LSGRAAEGLRLARAELTRARRTGERLVEIEARLALGACLTRLARTAEGARELARAEAQARTLPYPAGARWAAWARELLLPPADVPSRGR
ncbi:hypothetical protein, partial [Streptomyces sp. SID11385]|uniref:hypothetical protein n=1 Tax=Streptomyces sp. SID11385 TaxID=2706031 RepID=UPI0013C9516E